MISWTIAQRLSTTTAKSIIIGAFIVGALSSGPTLAEEPPPGYANDCIEQRAAATKAAKFCRQADTASRLCTFDQQSVQPFGEDLLKQTAEHDVGATGTDQPRNLIVVLVVVDLAEAIRQQGSAIGIGVISDHDRAEQPSNAGNLLGIMSEAAPRGARQF